MLKSIYHLKQTVANKRKSLAKKKQVKEHSQWASNVSRTMCVIQVYFEHMQCTWTKSFRIATYHEYECGTSVATSFVSTPNIHAFADKTVLLYTVWIQLWFVCRWARIVLARRLNNKVCSILPIFSRTNSLYRADFHHLFIRCQFLFLKKRINSDYIFSPTKKSCVLSGINLVNWIKSKRKSSDKVLAAPEKKINPIFFLVELKTFEICLIRMYNCADLLKGKRDLRCSISLFYESFESHQFVIGLFNDFLWCSDWYMYEKCLKFPIKSFESIDFRGVFVYTFG